MDLIERSGVRNGGFPHTISSFAHRQTPKPNTASDVQGLQLDLMLSKSNRLIENSFENIAVEVG
jgi:hypothetical protein